MVRFRVSQGFAGPGQYASVDNVQIAYGYPATNYPDLIDADALHAAGITGNGVTVAIVDSGYWSHPAIRHDVPRTDVPIAVNVWYQSHCQSVHWPESLKYVE